MKKIFRSIVGGILIASASAILIILIHVGAITARIVFTWELPEINTILTEGINYKGLTGVSYLIFLVATAFLYMFDKDLD